MENLIPWNPHSPFFQYILPLNTRFLKLPSTLLLCHSANRLRSTTVMEQRKSYFLIRPLSKCTQMERKNACFSDGIIQKINVEGERTIEFPNGQRETPTKCYKVSGDIHFCFLLVLKTSNYKEERVKHPLLDSEGGMESTLGLKGSFNTFFCCEKRNWMFVL